MRLALPGGSCEGRTVRPAESVCRAIQGVEGHGGACLDARCADKTSSLRCLSRLVQEESGLNRLRERWLAPCSIAQLVREGDWLTSTSRDVCELRGCRGAGRPDIDAASPTGGPSAQGRCPPVRPRMAMTISRRCSASSGPSSAVIPLRRSHRGTVARGTNPQAESGRGLRLTAGEVVGSGGVWDADRSYSLREPRVSIARVSPDFRPRLPHCAPPHDKGRKVWIGACLTDEGVVDA